ncbi:MAG: hypothetical protein BWY44_00378 [Candidatus Omnitrophica bacterium ADurb.Bin292]|nr:MAG: hypothetical protein BWY44_00378 [Candidatus Omnitrophica bacterium ADurb.Bin292]
MFDGMRHRDLGEFFGRKRGLDAFCFGHNPRNAKTNIIRALVTDDLERHAGHGLTLKVLRGGILRHRPVECGKKTRCGGTKSGADNIDIHFLTISHKGLSGYTAHATRKLLL